MKFLRLIFDDWLTRSAAVIFILIVTLVVFNFYSSLPDKYPLFGVLDYMMVPVLFIAGGVVFVTAVLRFSK